MKPKREWCREYDSFVDYADMNKHKQTGTVNKYVRCKECNRRIRPFIKMANPHEEGFYLPKHKGKFKTKR